MGVLICAGCYGRSRRLLADFDDMMGRLDSLADPMKATPMDKQPGGGGSTEPSAPIDADLLDAIWDVSRTAVAWATFTGSRTIDEAFDDIANDAEDVARWSEGWLDRTPMVDGIRGFWTVADAMAKWGPERRTQGEPDWVDEVSGEEIEAVPEWGDQLLNRVDSDRLAGSPSTLRRWVQKGLIEPVGTAYVVGRRTTLFRRSELMRVKADQAANQRLGHSRPRGSQSGDSN
ncbi:MAG: hypothetical protein AAGC61_01915 [Microbacterium sp.]